MGHLEWGVSGGGSMSQTMTSERGQKTDAKTYKNYIGGHWVEAKSGRTFTSTNPAHKDQVLGVMQASNADDVNAALEAAQKAFPGWRRTPAPARGEIVLKAALIIEARKEELARLMTQEMGKVLKEARGDVQEAIDMGKYAAGLGRHPHGETVPSELRNKWAVTVRVPIGVVACITPWNFPMAIPSWKIFPALMAGNAVVFKPASDTPIVATTLVEILEEAGLPGGGLNLVTGSGKDVGDVVVKDPRVQGRSCTGSTESGRHSAESAGRKDMRMAQEEIVGPSTLVLPVNNLEEALEVANSTQYGLSMSIYTNDLRKAFHAMDEMQSGIVYVNAPTIGAEIQLPFGGVKNTGNGHREAGTVALDEFTEWKTIYVDYSGRLQRAQIDTGE